MRRCLPTEAPSEGKAGDGDTASPPPPSTSAAASVEGDRARVKGRGRALGVGLGQAGRGGADSGWEEGEPTDFVYTGLFPHEVSYAFDVGGGGAHQRDEQKGSNPN